MRVERFAGSDSIVTEIGHYTKEPARETWFGWVRFTGGHIVFLPADGGEPVSTKGGDPMKPPTRSAKKKAEPAPGPGTKGGKTTPPKEG